MPYAITSIAEYRTLFEGVTDETAVGEASHSYLYTPEAPDRIRHYVPEAKLLAILRNPVQRAHSHFWYHVQHGREPLPDFAAAIEDEERRVKENWWPEFQYRRLGFYHAQLQRYEDYFARGQIKVILREDLLRNPSDVLRNVFDFLGVDDTFVPDLTRQHNRSGVPRHRAVEAFLGRPNVVKRYLRTALSEKRRKMLSEKFAKHRNRNLVAPPPIPPEAKDRLLEDYRRDITSLQHLIQRNLSSWLT